MNHIETKLVIQLSKRLANAAESREKLDLIEELTDNLYQKYLELTEKGASEEEALNTVMDSLGDVDELVNFLNEEYGSSDHTDPLPVSLNMPGAFPEVKNGAQDPEQKFSNAQNTYMKSDDEFPDILCEHIHSIKANLRSVDIEVEVCADCDRIIVDCDGDDIEITESADGELLLNRTEKRSGSFFSRFLSRSTTLTLTLPAKMWQRIELNTSSGDITINSSLQCRELEIGTASGDIELTYVQASRAEIHTASGNITAKADCEELSAGTASGDIEFTDSHCLSADLGTASGDITTENLNCDHLEVGTASGDSELTFSQLPQTLNVSSASGDCSIYVPANVGFELSYSTVSGDFSSDMPFSGIRSSKRTKLTYLTGGEHEISVSSSSGDFEIAVK